MYQSFVLFFLCFAFGEADAIKQKAVEQANAIFAARDKAGSHLVTAVPSRVLQSVTGVHVFYQRRWRNIEVVDRAPRHVHFDRNLNPLHLADAAPVDGPFSFALSRAGAAEKAREALAKEAYENLKLIEGGHVILMESRGPLPAFRFLLEASGARPALWQVDVDARSGRIVRRFNRYLYDEPGLTGRGRVYRHNPIASGRSRENATVEVPLRGLDGSGRLRGAYVDTTAPGAPKLEFDSLFSRSIRQTSSPSLTGIITSRMIRLYEPFSA